jgi:homoserine kinase
MTANANNGTGKSEGPARAIELLLPASSANLGPAFDSAAMALDLYLRIRAESAPDFAVQAKGRDADICEKSKHNLVLETYRDVLKHAGSECIPLALSIDNEIPIGKGCGSSAAARLAGISLAVHFGRLNWSGEQILEEAIRREGHADNVAACWLGGIVIIQSNRNQDGKRALPVRLQIAHEWPLLLVLSPGGLATGKSRALVPQLYGREVVVANIQSAMALVAAYTLGREDLFQTAQHDALHQPYRAKACPLLPCLQPLSGTAGVLAVTLSGAGSSVVLTLRRDASQDEVRGAVTERLRAAGLDGELLFTRMAAEGVRELPARAMAGERA